MASLIHQEIFCFQKNEKIIASNLYKLIVKKKIKLIKNKFFLSKFKKSILKNKVRKVDYLKIVDINKFKNPHKKKKNLKIFIAYYIKSTRLIDNI